jgi:hypothetical protein
VVAGLAVDDRLRERAAVDADDGRPASDGLQRDQPLGLDGAREREDVQCGVEGRQLLAVEKAERAGTSPQFLRLAREYVILEAAAIEYHYRIEIVDGLQDGCKEDSFSKIKSSLFVSYDQHSDIPQKSIYLTNII